EGVTRLRFIKNAQDGRYAPSPCRPSGGRTAMLRAPQSIRGVGATTKVCQTCSTHTDTAATSRPYCPPIIRTCAFRPPLPRHSACPATRNLSPKRKLRPRRPIHGPPAEGSANTDQHHAEHQVEGR